MVGDGYMLGELLDGCWRCKETCRQETVDSNYHSASVRAVLPQATQESRRRKDDKERSEF